MKTTTKSSKSIFNASLPWTLSGAIMATLIIIFFSNIYADESMKELSVLLIGALAGFAGGFAVFALKPLEKTGWQKAAFIGLGLVVYGASIAIGFAASRMGPL